MYTLRAIIFTIGGNHKNAVASLKRNSQSGSNASCSSWLSNPSSTNHRTYSRRSLFGHCHNGEPEHALR